MRLSDFDYHLPKEMIAQTPAHQRDRSKLLVLDLEKNRIEHKIFNEITEFLRPGDTIVLNDTRVVNARLFGHKSTGGKVELLILNPHTSNGDQKKEQIQIECLIKGRVRPGTEIILDLIDKSFKTNAKVIEQIEGGRFSLELDSELGLEKIISDYGSLPLPPYIKSDLENSERYQTIYSKVNGSVAAPTAGLHFTTQLLNSLKKTGVRFAFLTLHISYGTFTPVRVDDVTLHKMDSEYTILDSKNADIINDTRSSDSGRLIAVGTTAVRTLETIAHRYVTKGDRTQKLEPWEGWTDLFIYPGFEFKAGIDILITNFHLPKSTLLMLVSAFAGRDNILKAYQDAIDRNYRFYSLGDSMMIIK
jgi:S-adenosylmethionine:tRNA ribosyltransferase-isomerase